MEWKLLSPLAAAERAAVLAAARVRTYAQGEAVFSEGDPADSVHLVESGHLAVQITTASGSRATLNVLGPGDVVGELSLLVEGRTELRSATVLALEPSRTRVLSASRFHQLGREHPPVRDLLALFLADRIRELSGLLIESMYESLERRVHRRLAELADAYGGDRGGPVLVPLTQDQVSDMVGGTRPSVNKVLQDLAGRGMVELGRGRIVIRDVETLRRDTGY